MSQELERLYTTQEAAHELGISDSRLRGLIMNGEAHPLHQIGGTWLFTREEIERLRERPGRRRKSK